MKKKRAGLQAADIDEYFVTQVHGIKGEACGIGAGKLGNLFGEIEEAAKQKTKGRLRNFCPKPCRNGSILFVSYRRYCPESERDEQNAIRKRYSQKVTVGFAKEFLYSSIIRAVSDCLRIGTGIRELSDIIKS